MIRVAKTENGYVRGIEAADPRITSFKGIPFAAPPVGANRWRAPQPCGDWGGVRDASRFAPISVQDTPGIGDNLYNREWHVDPDIPMDEDCLYLNVWTGAKEPGAKLPVLVWYFGGGLQWGYPAEMEFDGERIARRGIVVVSVNYRLNVFGFLAHPELTAEQPDAPTNFGYLDQQAGLKWVIRNIEAFGGDPTNITIAGQSAGGGSVMAQLACRENFGLFQKAIVESGVIYDPYEITGQVFFSQTLERAEQNGKAFLDFLGVSGIEEARGLDAFTIRDRYGEYAASHPRMFGVVDGRFCVGNPRDLFLQNRCAPVPVMLGNTSGEFVNGIEAADEAELARKAKELFGDDAERFLSFPEVQRGADGRFAPVCGIECIAKAMALQSKAGGSGQNCYYYCFDADIPGWDDPGCFHSVELWFFFETLAKCWRPFKGAHYDLARQMCDYWCNFIRTGDPNGQDACGDALPQWKPYTKETPSSMIFRTQGASPEDRERESDFMAFLIEKVLRIL